MSKSLLEQLPEIVARGRQVAEKILESLEGRHRVGLQTREWVLPARDSAAQDWIKSNIRQDALASEQATSSEEAQTKAWHNRLIYGDNLLAMAALLAGDEATGLPSQRGQIDLIYIDPPFDSKADYRTKVILPGVELEQKPTVIEQFAYSDTWSDGTASYLEMITPRLVLMRELLKDTGSIYVHLDWHVGHYVKLVMDDVFGKDSFLGEIAWQRTSAHGDAKFFGNVIDKIFSYSKTTGRYCWEQLYVPFDPEYVASEYRYSDADGRVFRRGDLSGAGTTNGETGLPWRGLNPKSIGRHWARPPSELDELDAAGKIYWPPKGKWPHLKVYLDESPGARVSNLWRDIPPINNVAREGTGYNTQKPERLLERILQASCPDNGLVADFFGGSGTTAAVAERLGRRWITTDLGKPACMIMRKRLIDQNAQAFFYQSIGDYQVEAAKTTLGRDFRIGDLAQIVLSLFGAAPLSPEDNPSRNLGSINAGGVRTLIYADSPNKLTGAATLRKALAQRDNLLGGWDKVVVLGWNFEPAIAESITAINDPGLEVLVVPPDLLDRLKKKGSLEKLRGTVRFASLQYLKIKPVSRVRSMDGMQETLSIALDNYVLLSPEAINLDDANRIKLQEVMNKEPLAMIEYWAVDPDYDGKVFRSVWQDYRGNVANDGDPLRVITLAQMTVAAKTGPRRVCVRAVDVFGFEAEVSVNVAASAGVTL